MKNFYTDKSGQGLLEIIMAVAIFSMLISAMISLALGGSSALLQGGEQLRAEQLAIEALEASRYIGSQAWNELRFSQSAVATSSGLWTFAGEGSDETIGDYQRTIQFADVCRDALNNITNCPGSYTDKHSKKLSVSVAWEARPGVNSSITREAYLTNWDSRDWRQTDWSGGSGQAFWSDETNYETDDANLDYAYPGEIKLASLSNGACGTKTWDFNTASQYLYDAGLEIAGGYAQLAVQTGPPTYSTSNPAIRPLSSYTVNDISSWTSFSEVAIKTGSSEIYYQLSDDNGATWYYWTGAAWGVANSIANSNIAIDINTNINSFATTTAQLMFKAFLSSNGSDQVRLDSISLGCAQEYDWTFDNSSEYSYNNQKIEVSSSKAKLIGSSGSGSSVDSGFDLGVANNYDWPFDIAADYIYDNNKISVSGGLAELIGSSKDVFRVTEYFLDVGSFSGTTYNLSLNQNLASNYFVIIQGSDGSGTSATDIGASSNYVSLINDPWGTADLNLSGASNVITLFRNNATYSWVGTITVVECINNCSTQGFVLRSVERVNHSGTSTSGTDTSATAWTNLNQTMLMGGFNGSGCDTTGTTVGHHKACQARIWPSGSNTINWQRNSTGGTLTNAVSTVMVTEWGSDWTVQRVNVSGIAGGNGINSTIEYNTGTISSVNRANTWVWGTGWAAAGGIGNGTEGVVITLGNGVAKNTTETRVAVGAEYAISRSFEVYALTNPDLNVDYQFKNDGNSTSLTYDRAVAVASGKRMALVYNGCNGTTTTYPQSMFSARYYTDSSIRLQRRRSGQNFPAWIQGIDFSAMKTPITYPNDSPSIYPALSYSWPAISSWDSFTETATKNGGQIYYQLSSDNGANWQYWNGSAWSLATTNVMSNIASVIDANINTFPTDTDQIKFRAFLSGDGSQAVQLDNINIAYTQPASPWSFYTWEVGGGEVSPSGTLQINGGNPDRFAQIDINNSTNDEIGGFWQQLVSITSPNAQVNISFDYKSILFSAVPNLAEVRVYLDTSPGDPVNQVATYAVNGTSDWLNSGIIDASAAAVNSGDYYLKIAYWLDSTNNNGSYSVGFDNVSLEWSGTGYTSDSPSIQPNSAYSIANLDQYSGFTETATKTGGSEIYYQLSDNAGATWQYWNGLVWGVAGPADYNTADIINTNINSFATSTGSIIFRAFLSSNGGDTVELDNVKISWNEPGANSSQYPTNAYFISSAYDLGDNSPVQILDWQEYVPANTALKLQVRTAPDGGAVPGVWTDWYGETGANTYFIGAKQYLLPLSLNGNRWVQYRAEFSGDGTDTPVLSDIKINYR